MTFGCASWKELRDSSILWKEGVTFVCARGKNYEIPLSFGKRGDVRVHFLLNLAGLALPLAEGDLGGRLRRKKNISRQIYQVSFGFFVFFGDGIATCKKSPIQLAV